MTSIIEDDLHGIWICTQEGINNFNGLEFKIFNRGNTKGISSSYFTSSTKTSDGNLWFGTSNGLVCYDIKTASFTSYLKKKDETLFIEKIERGSNGILWILTQDGQLICFNSINRQFVKTPSFVPQSRIEFIYSASNEGLIVAQENQGVYYCDFIKKLKSKIAFPSLIGSETLQITAASSYFNNKKILFSCNSIFFSYSVKSRVLTRTFLYVEKAIQAPVVSMVNISGSWLFATNGQGLFHIGASGKINNSTEDIFQKNAILNNNSSCMIVDRSGVGWLGSERGVSSFNPNPKSFFAYGPSDKKEKGLSSQNVWAINESQNLNYTYIATDIGITRINKSKGSFEHFDKIGGQENVGAGSILCIEVLPQDNLLLGCMDGLYLLDINNPHPVYKKVKLNQSFSPKEHLRIYTIEKFRGSEYLLGTNSGVLVCNILTGKSKAYTHDPSAIEATISKGACRSIYKDINGVYWFATSGGGLNYLDSSSKIVPHPINRKISSLTKDMLTSICQINQDEYFFGTLGSGLMKINFANNRVELFSDKNGLPNNVIYGVLKAGDETVWMSTNKGICKFNFITNQAKNYDELNGLICNEFNSNAYYKASNGELFFGGIYGCNYFAPANIIAVKQVSNVKISFVDVDVNKSNPKGIRLTPYQLKISYNDVLDLNYNQRGFTIHFQPTNLISPKLIQYKYVLTGEQESDTNIISLANSVSFNSLSWGKYTIKIYARIADGEWSKIPAVLQVKINPPFWATFSFWFLALLGTILVVYVLTRIRTNNIRRENIRLEVKITQRTREILEQKKQIEGQNSIISKEKNKVIEQQKLLFKEKEKTEKWLRNALPVQIVQELKTKGKVNARAYKNVSVMFTDVVGFTKIAESISANSLVTKLDVIFRKFDTISIANNLEKIKTIGDAYMVAGGIPDDNFTHPYDTCIAALQIQAYMKRIKEEAIINGKQYWEIRIGINSGPVTAGVIGKLKIAYDVWGSTVNQAQRMEMLSEPGNVTISETTFGFIQPYFICEYKGKAETKSKSLVDMYVVHKIKAELSENGLGLEPNDRFYEIVQLYSTSIIKYYKLEHDILSKLTVGLNKKYIYHSVEHTKDVVKSVERIAFQEGITDENLFLLKTAALFHDAGFLKQYEKNEEIGAKMAAEMLPKYGYSPQHIKRIVELIHVTEIPHKPLNHIQEIICDADLDYLGRADFDGISDNLKAELKTMKKINSDRTWDEMQVVFFNKHKYFTKSAIDNREKKKQANLATILTRLEENNYAN